jgi:transcriptional antiterminator NusG
MTKVKTKKQWYAIRTMAGKERKAKENIEREVANNGIGEWVGEIVLPIDNVYKLRNGKKFKKEKLVFPGYIFVELQLIGEVERVVKRTNMVIGFAGDRDRKPIPMKDSEINRIKGKMEEVKKSEDNGVIPFIVGETISVIDGPFSGFNGEVGKVNHEKQTLEIKVLIFGRETPVTLSYLQVDKTV